ncbi:MAG: hypothetical protein ABI818_02060 [Acidobacteriota bacterium]
MSSHLMVIQDALRVVCKQYHVTGDDAMELQSVVLLKLLQGNSAILQRFRGESSLRTYLVVV